MPTPEDFESFVKDCARHFEKKYDKSVIQRASRDPVLYRVYDAWWQYIYAAGNEPSATIDRLRTQL